MTGCCGECGNFIYEGKECMCKNQPEIEISSKENQPESDGGRRVMTNEDMEGSKHFSCKHFKAEYDHSDVCFECHKSGNYSRYIPKNSVKKEVDINQTRWNMLEV